MLAVQKCRLQLEIAHSWVEQRFSAARDFSPLLAALAAEVTSVGSPVNWGLLSSRAKHGSSLAKNHASRGICSSALV